MPLSDRDRQILALAAAHYRHPAKREADARDQLGLSPVAFWVAVDRILDDPAAMAAEPMIVKRLRRLREARRRLRSA